MPSCCATSGSGSRVTDSGRMSSLHGNALTPTTVVGRPGQGLGHPDRFRLYDRGWPPPGRRPLIAEFVPRIGAITRGERFVKVGGQQLIGQMLDGRYRIDAPIARGGMSMVFRGVDTR